MRPQRAGFILLLCSLLVLFIYSMQYRISCQHKTQGQASQCQLTTSYYGLIHLKTTLPELKGARIIRSRWSFFFTSPRDGFYNIDLMTDGAPINMVYFPEHSRNDMTQVSNRINDYIANSSSTTFDIHSITSFGSYIGTFSLVVMALLILMIGFRVSITFDKRQNRFMLKQNLLFYFKTVEYPLDHLTGVQLVNISRTPTLNCYKLKFKIRGKRSIETIKFNRITETACEEMVTNINTFMGYEPEPVERPLKPTANSVEKKPSRYQPRLIIYGVIIAVLLSLQYFHIQV